MPWIEEEEEEEEERGTDRPLEVAVNSPEEKEGEQ